MKGKRALLLIVLIYIALALLYSLSTPAGEAPDEVAHFKYMRFIATTKRLPHLLHEGNLAGYYEAHQPPLYYGLEALFLHLAGQGNLDLHLKPHLPLDPQRPGARYIHGEEEVFPFRGDSRALHLLRLSSILFGALGLLVHYHLVRELFPFQKGLALCSVGINALIPQFDFVTGVLNNDSLAFLLSTFTLFCLIRLITRGNGKETLRLGLALGLALLTKQSTLYLLPLTLAGIFTMRKTPKEKLLHALVVLGITSLVAGWWYGRNYILYGEVLGIHTAQKTVLEGFVQAKPPTSPYFITHFFPMLFKSFWATFGYMDISAPSWAYGLWILFCLSGLGGLFLRLSFREGEPLFSHQRQGLLLSGLSVLLLFSEVWALNLLFSQPQGRLLFPSLAPLCLLWAWGFSGLSSPLALSNKKFLPWLSLQASLWLFSLALLLALNLYVLFFSLRPSY